MLTVGVHSVDGGLQEWSEPDALHRRLIELRLQGMKGKRLIHALLTDDWGPPPMSVTIHGTLADGTEVDERLPYD